MKISGNTSFLRDSYLFVQALFRGSCPLLKAFFRESYPCLKALLKGKYREYWVQKALLIGKYRLFKGHVERENIVKYRLIRRIIKGDIPVKAFSKGSYLIRTARG